MVTQPQFNRSIEMKIIVTSSEVNCGVYLMSAMCPAR